MMPYGAVPGCQVCGQAKLRSVLFMGYLPPVNRMRPIGASLTEEPWFPAELFYCRACHLVQLGYAVDPAILFPPDYPYTSGTTRVLRENFADLYREVRSLLALRPEDLVVDVGANDGTLLKNFRDGGHRVLGIEPSLTARLAEAQGIPSLMRFFDEAAVAEAVAKHGRARLVTATNVFAHIHDVGRLMDNLGRLLAPDGIFISESHYLLDLVQTLQYDTIYHEHLRYYSLTSLQTLLATYGFRVFRVTRIPTHGGSIRVYASRAKDQAVDGSVEARLADERAAGLAGESWIPDFRARVTRSKLQLYELLARLKADGASIYGIGAPSRASTLVNYVGLDDGIVECVLELPASKKVDKYLPGTRIPVLDEARLYADQPPYALLLSWHIAAEMCANLTKRGYRGDFIVPLPEPRVIPGGDVQV